MISSSELEKLLEHDLADLEPELRQLARVLASALNDLDQRLLNQNLPKEERGAIHRTVLTAMECYMRGLPPPSDEVKFWMSILNPKVLVPDSQVQ